MEQTVQCPDKGQTLGKEKLTRWEKSGYDQGPVERSRQV